MKVYLDNVIVSGRVRGDLHPPAGEFIPLKVDVILTYATLSSIAAKKATAVIPIVFAAAATRSARASSPH
jgi:hypothetical protein